MRCRFFSTSRGCLFGDRCRFVHEDVSDQAMQKRLDALIAAETVNRLKKNEARFLAFKRLHFGADFAFNLGLEMLLFAKRKWSLDFVTSLLSWAEALNHPHATFTLGVISQASPSRQEWFEAKSFGFLSRGLSESDSTPVALFFRALVCVDVAEKRRSLMQQSAKAGFVRALAYMDEQDVEAGIKQNDVECLFLGGEKSGDQQFFTRAAELGSAKAVLVLASRLHKSNAARVFWTARAALLSGNVWLLETILQTNVRRVACFEATWDDAQAVFIIGRWVF